MTNTETVSTERLEELLRLEIGDRDRYLEGTFLWRKHDDKAKAFAEMIAKRTLASRTQSPAEWQATVGTTLNFFASVIKSGEPWTATCQAEFDKAHTALRAASIPAPERSKEETVGVKPLEWTNATTTTWHANSVVGWYNISGGAPKDDHFRLACPGQRDGFKVFSSLDEAKAAAQADYEQRIKSALAAPVIVPVPVTITEGMSGVWISAEDMQKILSGYEDALGWMIRTEPALSNAENGFAVARAALSQKPGEQG